MQRNRRGGGVEIESILTLQNLMEVHRDYEAERLVDSTGACDGIQERSIDAGWDEDFGTSVGH